MNFLFPLYMLGAAAIAIPILLHLRRRPPQQVMPFSALMFLEAGAPPPVEKRRLDDLLLLLLRCLALLLLAMLFARPLWKSALPGEKSQDAFVILLDVSASMRREGMEASWKKQIATALDEIKESDRVSLVTFSTSPAVSQSHEEWQQFSEGQRKAQLQRLIRETKPGWSSTDLGKALAFATALLGAEDQTLRHRRILLISDMQEGASLDALASHTWPEAVSVQVLPVSPEDPGNVSLAMAGNKEATEGPATPASYRVRVKNAGDREAAFSITWKNEKTATLTGTLAPGASRILPAPSRDSASQDGILELNGDTQPFDNRVWFARQTPRLVRVLMVTDNINESDPTSSLYFLSKALRPDAAFKPVIIAKTAETLQPDDLEVADLMVLTSEVPPALMPALQGWLEEGHTLFQVLSENTKTGSIAKLMNFDQLVVKEASGRYSMLAELDFAHPLLKPFADSAVRDFTKIRFWKHRLIELPASATVVAKFDDGSPALFEKNIGKGRLMVLNSGWTPAESQLAVSSKFVPLLYSLMDLSGLTPADANRHLVGEPILIEPSLQENEIEVLLPSGRKQAWSGGEQPLFTDTAEPGFYRFYHEGQQQTVALNLSPEEGRTAPLDVARLTEYGVRLKGNESTTASVADDPTILEDNAHEARQKLWLILAATLLAVLLLETLVAGLRESRPIPAAT
jgi:hypothetical protein